MQPVLLDAADVRRLLDLDRLIDVMEETLAVFSSGGARQPVRQALPVTQHGGFFVVMPALLGDAMGTKLVTFYPRNAERGLETHMALVTLFEPSTGEPLVVMDGTYLTEMRTAAVSAAATRRLAAGDARVLAILGSGVQARSHLELLSRVRGFEEVRIWSPTREHVERFVEAARPRHAARIVACDSAEAAVRGASVVVTATSATEPVLRGAWLEPGAHVNAVGACVAGWRELDDDAMRNLVYVDSRAAAAVESGDVILSKCPVYAELGELFSGAVPARADEITVFKSLGLAVEDVAAASLVWRAFRGERRPVRVLFVCTHNSARSQMAEAILRRAGGGRFEVQSAGTQPGRVHPLAIEVMADRGLDLGSHRSKSVNELTGKTFDYVITVCDGAKESCPLFPGAVERLHWSIADPSTAEGTESERRDAFERAAAELSSRIDLLVTQVTHRGAQPSRRTR
jgi:ornithine cyclodeaminase/alanine dehydrogenase-like protein (mu-crystallin family)